MKSKKPKSLATVSKDKVKSAKNHPFIVPVITILAMFGLSVVGFIGLSGRTFSPNDAHFVVLSQDGKEEILPSRAETVGEFLERAEIQLEEGDVVEPAQDALIVGEEFKINIYRARPVTIIDGDKKTFTLSAAPSTRTLAEQAGVAVYPEDLIEREPARDFLRDGAVGEKVVITRATPAYLNLYGTLATVRTHAKTVNELLEEKGVVLAEDDRVTPELTSVLQPNTSVFVTRAGVQVLTTEENIPMPLEVVEDNTLSFGAQVIRQRGAPGKKSVTYEIQLENGLEVSRKVIQEVTIMAPVKQIVARGPQGSFGEALAMLRQCEAGGRYTAVSSSGTYMGAYQFNQGTWNTNAPPPYNTQPPHTTPPHIQDIAATSLYQRRGWQPWPACSQKLGLQDIYR